MDAELDKQREHTLLAFKSYSRNHKILMSIIIIIDFLPSSTLNTLNIDLNVGYKLSESRERIQLVEYVRTFTREHLTRRFPLRTGTYTQPCVLRLLVSVAATCLDFKLLCFSLRGRKKRKGKKKKKEKKAHRLWKVAIPCTAFLLLLQLRFCMSIRVCDGVAL